MCRPSARPNRSAFRPTIRPIRATTPTDRPTPAPTSTSRTGNSIRTEAATFRAGRGRSGWRQPSTWTSSRSTVKSSPRNTGRSASRPPSHRRSTWPRNPAGGVSTAHSARARTSAATSRGPTATPSRRPRAARPAGAPNPSTVWSSTGRAAAAEKAAGTPISASANMPCIRGTISPRG